MISIFLKGLFGRDYVDVNLIGRLTKFEDANEEGPYNFVLDAYTTEDKPRLIHVLRQASEAQVDEMIIKIGQHKDRKVDKSREVILNP